MLITFEGIDGCGKTTQAQLLAAELGERAVLVREPGGTGLGERLRELLKDSELAIDARAELLMFCAARAELVEEVIRPSLEAGRTVLCDRFTDSTVAYQGYARGIGAEVVGELNRIATAGLTPGLTLLFEIDPASAAARIGASADPERLGSDRFEAEGIEFQRLVAEAYAQIAAADPSRVRRVDADRPQEDVAADVARIVAEAGVV